MQSEFTLIEAAADGKQKVVGTAYSGGKMKLPGWKYPVVVDLAGMEIPEAVPLLANHENKTGARVGMVASSPIAGAKVITIQGIQYFVIDNGNTKLLIEKPPLPAQQ